MVSESRLAFDDSEDFILPPDSSSDIEVIVIRIPVPQSLPASRLVDIPSHRTLLVPGMLKHAALTDQLTLIDILPVFGDVLEIGKR